jgi:hypothetical protein
MDPTNRDDATQRTRAEVLRVVRNAGLFEVADELAAELPEVVDLDRDHALFERHGLDVDELTSRMGGSP